MSHSASSAVRLSAMPNACAWAGSRSVTVTLISSHPNSRAASSVPFPAMTTPRESTTIGFCCPNTSSESRIALRFRGECLRAFAGSFFNSAILRRSTFKILSSRPTYSQAALVRGPAPRLYLRLFCPYYCCRSFIWSVEVGLAPPSPAWIAGVSLSTPPTRLG